MLHYDRRRCQRPTPPNSYKLLPMANTRKTPPPPPVQAVQNEQPYWNPSRKTVSPESLVAFAHRLHRRMEELGLTQAELARRAFGVVEGPSGTPIAKDRDKISLYLRGKGLPGAEKMRALATALQMPLEDLAPRSAPPQISLKPHLDESRASAPVAPSFLEGVSIEPSTKGLVRLMVNLRVPEEDAAEIHQLILQQKARANAR